MGSDYFMNPPHTEPKSLGELVADLETEIDKLSLENEKLHDEIDKKNGDIEALKNTIRMLK